MWLKKESLLPKVTQRLGIRLVSSGVGHRIRSNFSITCKLDH
jgi:hypothetical protein